MTAVGSLVWWALRRGNKSQKALEIAQRAFDLLAWFLKQGQPLPEAQRMAVKVLAQEMKLKQETAARAVAGAVAKLEKPTL